MYKKNKIILKKIKRINKEIEDAILKYKWCSKYSYKEVYDILNKSFKEINNLKNQLNYE